MTPVTMLLACDLLRAFHRPEPMQTFTEQNFDELGFHDCHVHGWGIAEAAEGLGTLTLDIDYITAWEQPGDGTFTFLVAPATLVFVDVYLLVLAVNYTSFCVKPFSIDGIERESYADGYRYRIEIGEPLDSLISFCGNRFRMAFRAPPIRSTSQCLAPAARVPMSYHS